MKMRHGHLEIIDFVGRITSTYQTQGEEQKSQMLIRLHQIPSLELELAHQSHPYFQKMAWGHWIQMHLQSKTVIDERRDKTRKKLKVD
jgi:hypothetical protein